MSRQQLPGCAEPVLAPQRKRGGCRNSPKRQLSGCPGETMRAFLRSSEACFPLKAGTTTVGRGRDADIVLESAGVEERHAALACAGPAGGFVLQDFNSAHGTFVNDCRVQNAAVSVSPGDTLRFGSGGASYQLAVDEVPQLSYPPVKRRTAWPGQHQLVTEPKLHAPSTPPHLPLLQSQHCPSTHSSWASGAGGRVPHPPLRKHPMSAWARSVTSSFSPDTFSRSSAARQDLTNVSGSGQSGAAGVPSLGIHNVDFLLQEKDEKLLRLEKEISRLSGFETEMKHKDTVIANLQDEIAMMAKTMAQAAARNNVELTQKLLTFDREMGAKMGEIKALKEQRIGELEFHLKGLQGEIQKYCTEQETIRNRLSEKAKAEEELKKACERKSQQLQEMGRRERLLKSDLDRAKDQLESLKHQVVQVCFPQATGTAEKSITDQQLIEKIRQISEENHRSLEKEKFFQEEISSRLSKEKKLSENVEVFKESLCELQAFLKTSCCSTSLRRELCNFEALCVDPFVLEIHTAVVETMHQLLAWMEGVEQLLESAGLDLPSSDKGENVLRGLGFSNCSRGSQLALRSLSKLWLKQFFGKTQAVSLGLFLDRHFQKSLARYRRQAQLDKVQESQDALLQEHLNKLKVKHEEDLRIKINQIILEKEEESKEILESAVAKEKDKFKQSVDEEQKKIQDLENHLRNMTEVIETKSKEQEVVNVKLREAVDNLKETAKREIVLKQQLLMQDKQLKSLQNENDLLKQKLQEEIMEYKEQIKQHSQTIVALEDRLLEAKQQQKTLEEENVALLEKIEGFQGDPCRSSSAASLAVCHTEEPHGCLIEELAAAQNAILSKEAVIARLTKELVETKARMSDMRGELSEKQKVELERNLSRVKSQESELNMLREKLFEMSNLVDKKDKDLEAVAEELRQAHENLKLLKDASKETAEELKTLPQTQVQARTAAVDEVSERDLALDLANIGAKCRGLRHEETIRRQKEGLAELRERLKVLEKARSSTVTSQGPEPLVVLKRDLPEEIVQKAGLRKELLPLPISKRKACKFPSGFPNGCSPVAVEEPANVEVSDALDLSEKMYLDLIRALGALMNMKELTGMQSVKHLSQEEREKVGLQRQKDLELLYDKISKLKSRLERKEEMIKDYEASAEQLRLNQVSLQACQEEMTKLEDEVYREAEENALLKEALERTQVQLNQEKRLNQVVKLHKNLVEDKEKRNGKELPGCARSQKGRVGKPGAQKFFLSEKQKMKDRTGGSCKAVRRGQRRFHRPHGTEADDGETGSAADAPRAEKHDQGGRRRPGQQAQLSGVPPDFPQGGGRRAAGGQRAARLGKALRD
ncbi:forkhead-associated domain-containing protein 1 isoform X4 [Struthio camelus]|uniref:forkhead-associated domain-containing protein 1 isoform X4 n=1 Tax=Struthio camelus TaxID=8801 RepID=UPI003603B395